MELSPAVDVPVTVNTVLTTDEGFMRASTAQPVMGSSTNYTSTFVISSFGRNDSGMKQQQQAIMKPLILANSQQWNSHASTDVSV